MTRVPETTSCRPALHQGALGHPPPLPLTHRHRNTHRRVRTLTHTHVTRLEMPVGGFVATGWKGSDVPGSGLCPSLTPGSARGWVWR